MKRINTFIIWVIFLFVSLSAQASDYSDLLLRTQASIYPKIVLLDRDVSVKTHDTGVLLIIVHLEKELEIAEKMKVLIEKQYKGRIGNYPLNVELSTYKKLAMTKLATAYVLLDGTMEGQTDAARHASSNNRLSFTYNYNSLKVNALVSLILKEKVYIYLNKDAVDDYGIRFLPTFYKIVKLLE